MMTTGRIALVFSSVALMAGCGSDDNKSGSPAGSSAPAITITEPAAGESVGPTAEYPIYPDIPVAFTVTGFTLKDPGTCAGAASCGHVHVLVDGTACNEQGAPYNAAGAASPVNAGLDYCPSIAGAHTVKVELHNDDHSPVMGSSGSVVSDSVDITAAAP